MVEKRSQNSQTLQEMMEKVRTNKMVKIKMLVMGMGTLIILKGILGIREVEGLEKEERNVMVVEVWDTLKENVQRG